MMTCDPDSLSDDDLLSRVAGGDSGAFTTLFRRRHGEVYRFALHMTGRPESAEDVVQEVFLAVMRGAGRYESRQPTASAWLCGIARNHARRRLQRDRDVVPLGDEEDEWPVGVAVHPDPIGDLTRAEGVAAVRRALLTLPLRYREIVVLCDLEELSYADAAAALECAIGTVRSRLHRARAMLAARLAPAPTPRREPGHAGEEEARRKGDQPVERPAIVKGTA